MSLIEIPCPQAQYDRQTEYNEAQDQREKTLEFSLSRVAARFGVKVRLCLVCRILLVSWVHGLVYRLAYNGEVAAGQLAVFQGASDEHI